MCLVTQASPALWDPMNCNPPSSSAHGILQARILGGLPCPPPSDLLNPDLPHCRQILYRLSHEGSLRILEWVAYPFSGGSSQPRNGAGVSCIAGGFSTSWAEPLVMLWQGILLAWSGLSVSRVSKRDGGGSMLLLAEKRQNLAPNPEELRGTTGRFSSGPTNIPPPFPT